MSNWIGHSVILTVWNDTTHVLHNFEKNTTAYHLGRYSTHLLLLKSYMTRSIGLLATDKQEVHDGKTLITMNAPNLICKWFHENTIK